jgi:hypothetical protein
MVFRITDVLTKSTIITIKRKKEEEEEEEKTDLVAAYFSNQSNP